MKYKIIKEDSKIIGDHKLYRIQSLKNFKSAREGDFGGYIESEENLSHEGDCWVYPAANVYEDGFVNENASVAGNVSIHGHSIVDGDSYLCAISGSHIEIDGNAQIRSNSHLSGNIHITDDVIVTGASKIISSEEMLVIGGKMCIGKDSVITDCDQDEGFFINDELEDSIINRKD